MPLITRRKSGQSVNVYTKTGEYLGKITVRINPTATKAELIVDGNDDLRIYRTEIDHKWHEFSEEDEH